MKKNKREKPEVDYSPGLKSAHCGICTHFRSPNKCTRVRGGIDPLYWCELFKLDKDAQSVWVTGRPM